MKSFAFSVLLVLLLLAGPVAFGQTRASSGHNPFRLEKTIVQNGNSFSFYRHQDPDSASVIRIVRHGKKGSVVLFQDAVQDGEYEVGDRNGDGFQDFVLFYHDYCEVHPFDPRKNRFREDPFFIAVDHDAVKGCNNLFWEYQDAQYGEPYAWSVLYTFRKGEPFLLYKLVFEADEEFAGRSGAKRIALYRFESGSYEGKLIFQKYIPSPKPATFDYVRFWTRNSRAFAGCQ